MSTRYFKFAKQYLPKVRKKIKEYPELEGMDVKILNRRWQSETNFFDFSIGESSICRLSLGNDRKISFGARFTTLDYILYGWIEEGEINGEILIDFEKLRGGHIEDFYDEGKIVLNREELKEILNKMKKGNNGGF